MMWKRIQVPGFCERMIGFSVPLKGQVLVVSYEAMHVLTLQEPVQVDTDETYSQYDVYDPDSGQAQYGGRTWEIIGLHPGHPIVRSPSGERLLLDTSNESLVVMRNKVVEFRTKYDNFSGDWAAATFSLDGNYIVLGCPYDFDFRVWQRQG